MTRAEQIAAVLAEHALSWPRGYAGVVCSCGSEFDEGDGGEAPRAHVAAALDATLAAQEGERGGAEVAAAVEEAVSNAADSMRSAVAHGHGTYLAEGWHALCSRFLDRLDAALADPAGALAKNDAEVLRAAADDYDTQRGIPEGTHVGTWFRERADRIVGDQS